MLMEQTKPKTEKKPAPLQTLIGILCPSCGRIVHAWPHEYDGLGWYKGRCDVCNKEYVFIVALIDAKRGIRSVKTTRFEGRGLKVSEV